MFNIRKLCFATSLIKQNLKPYKMDRALEESINIFRKSVAAVDPKRLIQNNVSVQDDLLNVCGKQYVLQNNCYLIGFGKAVYPMATEIETILSHHLVAGIVSIPVGMINSYGEQQAAPSRVTYLEGAENNLPDAASEKAARSIADLMIKVNKDDVLIVLISGGGSALLSLPRPPISLEEKTKVIKMLSTRGANIVELNCVRKRMSELKGGQLAVRAYPANVVSLILSDVIGDPLDYIASGPTFPNRDPPDAAMEIIKKYAQSGQIPESVKRVLGRVSGFSTRKEGKSCVPLSSEGTYVHVENFVIGNNKLAADAAVQEAREKGFEGLVISTNVNGDVAAISEAYTKFAVAVAQVMKGLSSKAELESCLGAMGASLGISEETIEGLISLSYDPDKGVCLVGAGEPTVEVRGGGVGGRNQQLALQFSIDVNNALRRSVGGVADMNISLLSCGTDGIDGPTDAAGAFGFPELCALARQQNIDPHDYLARNDSYNFYSAVQDGKFLVRTGHTGTNVMDIHVLLVRLSKCKCKY